MRPSEGREPLLGADYICFTGVLDVVRWAVAGCYNGSQYKKG